MLVYALNLLLLVNVTVIVVLLTGMDQPTRQRADAPQPRVTQPGGSSEPAEPSRAVPPRPVVVETSIVTDTPAFVTPSKSSTPPSRVSSEPFVLADSAAAQDQAGTASSPEADPPVTFFGIGLD